MTPPAVLDRTSTSSRHIHAVSDLGARSAHASVSTVTCPRLRAPLHAARYAGAELPLTTASERNTGIAAVSLLTTTAAMMGDQGGYSTHARVAAYSFRRRRPLPGQGFADGRRILYFWLRQNYGRLNL